MSTDQPELSALGADDTPALHEETLDGAGAAYTPSDNANATAPQQTPENSCLNCGREVSAQIARVLGDNDGNIPACAAEECRADAIDDAARSENSYQVTARVVRAVRARKHGVTTDPTAGGRR